MADFDYAMGKASSLDIANTFNWHPAIDEKSG
jgi:hypothetical protein